MKILKHDIIDIWKNGYWCGITTNGTIKKNNECVMGAGVAKLFKKQIPELPKKLGEHIYISGNTIAIFPEYKLFSFPVKHDWQENADIKLIKKSAHDLDWIVSIGELADVELMFLPFPGIGNGRLKKEDVLPILNEELGSYEKRIVLVEE